MNDLKQNSQLEPELLKYDQLPENEQLQIKLEILDESIRRHELSRLTDMDVKSFDEVCQISIQDDALSNIRLFKITQLVYQTGESISDKLTTVYNALQSFKSSVYIIIDSDNDATDFYVGIRSNEDERSTVTIADTLFKTFEGHFPGMKMESKNRQDIMTISEKIKSQKNITSVSVVANQKATAEEAFMQGLDKLILAMQGCKYTAVLVAENSSTDEVQLLRKSYQELYSQLSEFKNTQISTNTADSISKSQSFFEMDKGQKSAMIGAVATTSVGSAIGFAMSNTLGLATMLGGQVGNSFGTLINSFAPVQQKTSTTSLTSTVTRENKQIIDILDLIEQQLKRTNEFDSYGMWKVSSYFVSDDMSTAEIAASNYRSLMNGDDSGQEISAINSWRSDASQFIDISKYISRFMHPIFIYGGDVSTSSATFVSGKQLGIHLGMPRNSVSGLPVINHAQFGKEITSYQIEENKKISNPKEQITLGNVFDLGKVTNSKIELDHESLGMHTFITGSTGSGKSNTVYQIILELMQDDIPFLVIEPAKGEYKDVFGNLENVNVYGSNPNISELININPFMFPKSIHILEHIDGLVEIFSSCWSMYDSMVIFLKNAILESYVNVGWDLGTSTNTGGLKYPNFQILAEQLERLIHLTDYSEEVKGNYIGALVTRIKSLTLGLNKYIFSDSQTAYEKLFDQNCIIDISRIKSQETRALIMGLLIYILNQYRIDQKTTSNVKLKHVTILEEAHNLLKNNQSNSSSQVMSASVEILTNTIAEIRTLGEGFIIVDQSASSVDIAAIKNTNTKIVHRTLEANDREIVGNSMGLTKEQVTEISKLPRGVAVVFQNDWINPVLTKVVKANTNEKPFVLKSLTQIMQLSEARKILVIALMQPWIKHNQICTLILEDALKTVEISSKSRTLIGQMLQTYTNHNGKILWNQSSLFLLKNLLLEILDISANMISEIIKIGVADNLRLLVTSKTTLTDVDSVNEICNILSQVEKDD